MGLLDNLIRLNPFRKKEGRHFNNQLYNPYFSQGSTAGVQITKETATTFSAVYAAIKTLSESVAQLPLYVYKKESEKVRVFADQHNLYNLLHNEPNSHMTSYTFFETMMRSLLLNGNCYAHIKRDKNANIISLDILDPDKITPTIFEEDIYYMLKETEEPIFSKDIIHVLAQSDNGYMGISPIDAQRGNIAFGVALQEYGNRFFAQGANLKGVLATDKTLSEEAINRLKNSWDANYSGLSSSHKTAVLEEGLKFQSIQLSNDQAQFLSSRKYSVEEVARMFRLPLHLLQHLEHATYSNIEVQNREFVQFCLMPYIRKFETELNRKLFKQSEKNTFYVKFDVASLLRGDMKARGEYYKSLFNLGALSPNDIRAKEDMNPIEQGDDYYLQLNLAPIGSAPAEDEIIIEDEEPEAELNSEKNKKILRKKSII